VLQFSASLSANGRLEQPLTYWNAMGELAAIGFVLSARMAGDVGRSSSLRASAAAAMAPLGMALYISFSRGALFACAAGLVALTVMAPNREQAGATVRAVVVGMLAAAASAPFAAVTALMGSESTKERQGAIVLILSIAIAAAAAAVQVICSRRERAGEIRLPRHASLLAAGIISAGLALAIVLGAHENNVSSQTLSTGATRLASLQSNRYAYWSVALRAFSASPLRGVGAGGWSVDWLRWRHVKEVAQDAHSLPLQTLAELGLVGGALLAASILGVVMAARQALRENTAVIGLIATMVVYLAHAPLDWDWQMPAVTLVAMVAAGAVLGQAELHEGDAPGRLRGHSRSEPASVP
jgi:O-antigen ligase